uniref:Intraflagellar transport protein 122 homolog n=1 Tax=Heterorhabditis bacteriophora TaxID=37862 RepID=A0A1I7X466_HETBA
MVLKLDFTAAIVTRFSHLTITCARWSPNGSFFAVTGQQMDMPQQERSVLHIVTAYGVKLTSLKVMCDSLNGCAWDPTGVKLALCAENQLYFANVRPRYKWGYCGQTVIYSYEKPDRSDYRVVFYETKLDEAFSKPIRNLEQIASYEDYCIIVNKQDDTMGMYLIQLCNGIGTCVDFKYVDVEPRCVGLNGTWAVIAGTESYFIWRFVVPKRNAMNLGRSADIKEDTVHMLDSTSMGNELGVRRKYCESGALYKVALVDGSIINKYNITQNVVQIQLNSSKQRLATLDMSNQLQLFDLGETSVTKVPGADMKEVVDFCWDKVEIIVYCTSTLLDLQEKDDSIAYISKQKLIVLRGREPEEGVPCEGLPLNSFCSSHFNYYFLYRYICSFCGLTVRTVLLDNFLLPNMKSDRKFVIDIEIKSFREAKVLLERVKIQEASEFIEKNPHPRLWSLLAEVALNKLDIPTAEHAYVMLQDYSGLQFCKRLQRILNNDVKRAEVAAHLGKLEEAERIYIDTDRRHAH